MKIFLKSFLVFLFFASAGPVFSDEKASSKSKPLLKKIEEALKQKKEDKKSSEEDKETLTQKDVKKAAPLKKRKKIKKMRRLSKENLKKLKKNESCTTELKIQGVISSATLDSVEKAIRQTQKLACSSLLLLINTPGGMLLSTRKIVEAILSTPFPILCLVHPSGAHAGSAGAIILQACHVNGAVSATNIGAATPILGMGKDAAKDLRKKMINDATSWLDSLTELRKRDKQFGRDIVREAKALSARQAHNEGAIDFFGSTKEEFLKFAEGVLVQVKDKKNQAVLTGSLKPIHLGIQHHIISFVTDPQIAYMLFTGSLLLIYFEITHPGMVVPGVLGAMGLVLSLTGLHKLNFVWGGLILMLMGIIFMVLEAFTAVGFGFLGLGGAVSFIVGSFFLFDPSKTGGLDIGYSTIILTSLIFAVISLGTAYLAFTALRKKRDEEKNWVGMEGEVVQVKSDFKGLMEIQGEVWKIHSKQKLQKGDRVSIVKYSRMTFEVQKISEKE